MATEVFEMHIARSSKVDVWTSIFGHHGRAVSGSAQVGAFTA